MIVSHLRTRPERAVLAWLQERQRWERRLLELERARPSAPVSAPVSQRRPAC